MQKGIRQRFSFWEYAAPTGLTDLWICGFYKEGAPDGAKV
jgi:hypothetical protein